MKPKRYYHRPPYKKMWQAMNDEADALRLEVTNLRKENKSLKMASQLVSPEERLGRLMKDSMNVSPFGVDNVECQGNVIYRNTPPSLKPLYDQPKHRTWWERLWGLT